MKGRLRGVDDKVRRSLKYRIRSRNLYILKHSLFYRFDQHSSSKGPAPVWSNIKNLVDSDEDYEIRG